jgi:hypothetical protein
LESPSWAAASVKETKAERRSGDGVLTGNGRREIAADCSLMAEKTVLVDERQARIRKQRQPVSGRESSIQ